MAPTALHLISGYAAAANVKAGYGLNHDRVLPLSDPVSCGPAPQLDNLDAWRAMREQHHRSTFNPFAGYACLNWPDNDLLLNFDRLKNEDKIIVWLGPGTPDRLFAAWLVHYMQVAQCDLAKLHFVTFDQHSRRNILSVGELSHDRIRDWSSEPTPATADQIEEYALVWRCYSADTPLALEAYLTKQGGPLRDAVAPILLRYPEVKSGLGFWDLLLLENVRDYGPRLLHVIGITMIPFEVENFLDVMGDGFVFDPAVRLTSRVVPNALLVVDGNQEDVRTCTVSLTTDGTLVLEGITNAVRLNGIDDWVGGVHMTTNRVFFRDGAQLV